MSKELKKIRTGALSRGFALARTSFYIGSKTAGKMLSNVLSSDNRQSKIDKLLKIQLDLLARELGKLKGA
jgi:hypothetical protein